MKRLFRPPQLKMRIEEVVVVAGALMVVWAVRGVVTEEMDFEVVWTRELLMMCKRVVWVEVVAW